MYQRTSELCDVYFFCSIFNVFPLKGSIVSNLFCAVFVLTELLQECSAVNSLLGSDQISLYGKRTPPTSKLCDPDPVSSYFSKLTTFHSFDLSVGRRAPHILDSGLELSQRVKIWSCPEVGMTLIII